MTGNISVSLVITHNQNHIGLALLRHRIAYTDEANS